MNLSMVLAVMGLGLLSGIVTRYCGLGYDDPRTRWQTLIVTLLVFGAFGLGALVR